MQVSSPECGYECAFTDTTSIPFKHGRTIKLPEGGSSVQVDIRISQFEAQVLPDADITVVRYCFCAGFPAHEGIRVQLNCGPTTLNAPVPNATEHTVANTHREIARTGFSISRDRHFAEPHRY